MTGQKPTAENKLVARHAAKAFGGAPRVTAYHHDQLPLSVDILACADQPTAGVTSYATLGLSDHPMPHPTGGIFPTRLELAGAVASGAELFPNVLASAAFHIMRSGRLYMPGSFLPGYVAEYYPDTTVPHLYLTAPYLWDKLKSLDCQTKVVAWLLAVPISAAEADYLAGKGDKALEELFEERQIDIYDLTRPSTI